MASAGDLRAFDQLAQQQIALAVVKDGHDPHGLGCSLLIPAASRCLWVKRQQPASSPLVTENSIWLQQRA
jgi:hypothetical protein